MLTAKAYEHLGKPLPKKYREQVSMFDDGQN